jgi:uncharacterized membrane protein
MLGIALSAFAAFLFGISTVLQKRCLKGIKKFSIRKIIKKKLWILSILMGLAGIVIYLAALKFESISIVQPMLSISIAVSVLFGWFIFDEETGSSWIYIILIVAGVLLISL